MRRWRHKGYPKFFERLYPVIRAVCRGRGPSISQDFSLKLRFRTLIVSLDVKKAVFSLSCQVFGGQPGEYFNFSSKFQVWVKQHAEWPYIRKRKKNGRDQFPCWARYFMFIFFLEQVLFWACARFFFFNSNNCFLFLFIFAGDIFRPEADVYLN